VLNLAVLGSTANQTNVVLVEKWRSLGLICELVDPREARHSAPEVALARLDVRPTLDGVEPGLLELLWLERAGTRVLNRTSTLLATHDKLRTAAALGRAGLAHPVTRHVRPHELGVLPRAPVVLKPRFGSWGRDVRLCRTDREISDALRTFASRPWFVRHGVLVQEAIPTPGFDLRVLVGGGRVIGAVQRHSKLGEWRTNVAVGASKHPASAPPEARAMAIAAAEAVGADLVGVDLMPLSDGGHVIIELNGAADFDQAYCPDRDIYADVADALGLISGTKARRESGRKATAVT
jgi:[lysine-biosynthesis-protein LysW]--L-2-aminoadipate ligase